jgi:hypothetical protein
VLVSIYARLFQEPSAIRVRALTIDPAIFSLAAWNFAHEGTLPLARLLCKPSAKIAEEVADAAAMPSSAHADSRSRS